MTSVMTPGQVPYDKKSTIPGKASLTTFRCIERNRLVRGEEVVWTLSTGDGVVPCRGGGARVVPAGAG